MIPPISQAKLKLTNRYIFDPQAFNIPLHLKPVIPHEVLDAFNHLRDNTWKAYSAFCKVEDLHSTRYSAMCPKSDIKNYWLHDQSVRQLMSWREDHTKIHHCTLAPSAKIDAATLRLRFDSRAYREFAPQLAYVLDWFYTRPLKQYRAAKRELEHRVSVSSMSEMDKEEFLRWFRGRFLNEMAKWEDRVVDLAVPAFGELFDEVVKAIRYAVEDPQPVLHELATNYWDNSYRYGCI